MSKTTTPTNDAPTGPETDPVERLPDEQLESAAGGIDGGSGYYDDGNGGCIPDPFGDFLKVPGL